MAAKLVAPKSDMSCWNLMKADEGGLVAPNSDAGGFSQKIIRKFFRWAGEAEMMKQTLNWQIESVRLNFLHEHRRGN